jgi:hypothetical protein
MKRLLLPVLLSVLCIAHAADAVKVPVKLLGPEEVIIAGKSCVFWELPYEIEFTWKYDKPLELDTYLKGGVLKAGPYVDFLLRDKHGKNVDIMFFVSMPPFPTGHLQIKNGEHLKIGLYAWNGIAEVRIGEPYTVTAKVAVTMGQGAPVLLISDERTVKFTHSKGTSKL